MSKVFIHVSNDKRLRNNQLFNLNIDPNLSVFVKLREYLRSMHVSLDTLEVKNADKADLIIFHDIPYTEPEILVSLSTIKTKKVLFIYEPPIVNPFNYLKFFHRVFDRVYTWNDSLVDNKKYYKFNICMSQQGLNTTRKPYGSKKLLVVVNGNKLPFLPFNTIASFGKELYSQRLAGIEYFEQSIPNDFELWGKGWNRPRKHSIQDNLFGPTIHPSYRGPVEDKLELLSRFRFCLCFENLTNVDGYITEKIFDCFKAKCIPIYWGADNVTDYIPRSCFIDYRDFMDFGKLLSFLQSMDTYVYEEYIDNIEDLLKNKSFFNMWFENGCIKSISNVIASL